MSRNEAYTAAVIADETFETALDRQFGPGDNGTVRYQNDRHNAETSAARVAYHAACDTLHYSSEVK